MQKNFIFYSVYFNTENIIITTTNHCHHRHHHLSWDIHHNSLQDLLLRDKYHFHHNANIHSKNHYSYFTPFHYSYFYYQKPRSTIFIPYQQIAMLSSISRIFSALTSKLLVFFFYEISTKLSKLLFFSFFLRHRLSSYFFAGDRHWMLDEVSFCYDMIISRFQTMDHVNLVTVDLSSNNKLN